MNKDKLIKLKNVVLEERKMVIHNAQLGKNMSVVDNDGDHIDLIQGNMLVTLQNQLSLRNSNRLLQLDEALKRIEDNCYGICEDCEDDIPYKRLLFNPCILTCVHCAESREMDK